jgi:hypothetical protein
VEGEYWNSNVRGCFACMGIGETMPARHIGIACQAVTLVLLVQLHLKVTHAQEAIGAVKANFAPGVRIPTPAVRPIESPPRCPVRKPFNDRSVRQFVLLSGGVYAAAALDMQESLSLRPRFHEDDPLARPISHLPAPGYYATGIAFATGVNWVGWRFARSERWHSLWWLPQLCSIAGNVAGYGYTRRHTRGP